MKATKNQTNHAEKLAIDSACNLLGNGYLHDCDMYVTLEPCHMCAAAISFVRIRRLYIGALDQKSGGVYHNSKLYYGKKLHHVPDHYSGLSEKACSQLMVDFFKNKRGGA
jgi:tRNA(Arg) A34 adenosine deaminase TadA